MAAEAEATRDARAKVSNLFLLKAKHIHDDDTRSGGDYFSLDDWRLSEMICIEGDNLMETRMATNM